MNPATWNNLTPAEREREAFINDTLFGKGPPPASVLRSLTGESETATALEDLAESAASIQGTMHDLLIAIKDLTASRPGLDAADIVTAFSALRGDIKRLIALFAKI